MNRDYWLFWAASSLGMGASNILQFTMAVMVLLYQHENVVDVDLDLLDEPDLKYDIIRNVSTPNQS